MSFHVCLPAGLSAIAMTSSPAMVARDFKCKESKTLMLVALYCEKTEARNSTPSCNTNWINYIQCISARFAHAQHITSLIFLSVADKLIVCY